MTAGCHLCTRHGMPPLTPGTALRTYVSVLKESESPLLRGIGDDEQVTSVSFSSFLQSRTPEWIICHLSARNEVGGVWLQDGQVLSALGRAQCVSILHSS